MVAFQAPAPLAAVERFDIPVVPRGLMQLAAVGRGSRRLSSIRRCVSRTRWWISSSQPGDVVIDVSRIDNERM